MPTVNTKKAIAGETTALEAIAEKNIPVVLDQETGKWYESTPEKHAYSLNLMREYQQSWLKQCLIIGEMLGPKKLYRDLGFGRKKEFCAAYDISPRKAQQMKQIGFFIISATLEDGNKNVNARSHLVGINDNDTDAQGDQKVNAHSLLFENGNFVDTDLGVVESIGFTKMRTIVQKLDTKQFAEFIKNNRLTVPDGTELTVQEIIDINTRELIEQFGKQSKAEKLRINLLTRENKKLKERADQAVEIQDKAEKKMAHALELELKYGKPASTDQEKIDLVHTCVELSSSLQRALTRLRVDDKDTEVVQDAVMALVNNMDHFWNDGGMKDKIKAAIRGDWVWE